MQNSRFERFTDGVHTDAESSRAAFREMAARSEVTLLSGGDLLEEATLARLHRALIVGVATWSLPDLETLDRLVDNARDWTLFVFDIDSCKTGEDLRGLIPGCPPVSQTPVVAEYRRGELQSLAQGPDAVAWSKSVDNRQK